MQLMQDLAEATVRAEASFRRTMAGIDNPRRWSRDGKGAMAVVTGVNLPVVNGVWVLESDPDLEDCGRMLDEVIEHDVPFVLQGRDGQRDRLEPIASAHAMDFDEFMPVMALPDLGRDAGSLPEGLTVRELDPSEFDVHCRLAAVAFEAPEALFLDLMALVAKYPGVRVVVGEVDGDAVTTALTVPAADRSVGVFNVATPAVHRRNGYGKAVTDFALSAARHAGAQWAWLTSSPDGLGVYSRLGFRTVEQQPVWSRNPSPTA